MDKTPNKSQSSLLGIFINILLPVLILDYCSAGPANPLERPEGENFWHIGPVWALVIALSLPLVYGIRSLVVSRKFDLMSVVGMAGVLLTGVISIFVIGPEGRIHSATPWLFAGKEALIPLILAAAVVVSRSAGTPLLNMFIYTPELFDVRRIEQTVAANGEEAVAKFGMSAPGTFDMIFMDVQMPVMNGHDAARAIRAMDRPDAGTIPIIAMTANAFAEDERQALSLIHI